MSSLVTIAMHIANDGAAAMVDASIKSAIVLLAAAIAAHTLKRTSAAMRIASGRWGSVEPY